MPRQVYRCPKHGEFEVTLDVGQHVPDTLACPKSKGKTMCLHLSSWVPFAPNFIGGPTTGAKKGD